MKKLLKILPLLLSVLLFASADVSPQQKYIDTWAATAVREMYRSGVPASITLAQGLLESGSGLSRLAREGNNHFGIKCHSDWKGRSMKVDDDAPKECFRVYDTADESFRDHSDFLRYWDRYKFLFEYKTTDYKSWAQGLKKAGYATAPTYANSLIALIEEYGLAKYDTMKPGDFADSEAETISDGSDNVDDNISKSDSGKKSKDKSAEGKKSKDKAAKASKDKTKAAKDNDKASKDKATKSSKDNAGKSAKKESKSAKKAREKTLDEEIPDAIPESPLSIEEAHPLQGKASEQFRFSLTRQMLSKNGVPFVYALDGETYSSIASANDLFLKELLKYNDAPANRALHPGEIVYLQPKKSQTGRGLDKYIVEEDGESLRDICQRFAVKQASIEKLNAFEKGHTLREGDTILLRKR